jgi:hypothetical protein
MQDFMQKLIKFQFIRRPVTRGDQPAPRSANRMLLLHLSNRMRGLMSALILIIGLLTLSSCGGNNSGSAQGAALAGNWQFVITNTADLTTNSGLQGGFLLQNGNSLSGSIVYSNVLLNSQTPCNSGAAPITGTITGQTVNLTAAAGTQTYTFTGTLDSNSSTISGTYTATPGPGINVFGTTVPCGVGTGTGTTLQWTATLVPSLNGSITGSFHSTTGASFGNGDFPVTGTLTQGQNIGASSATVVGTLSFIDPSTLASDYPCISMASINGQISGNNVILQIIGTSGTTIGQIGGTPGSGVNTVTLNSAGANTSVLQSAVSPGYAVMSPSCPGTALTNPGDAGSLCLALNNTTACQEPITLTPATLSFPPQLLGTNSATQTVTLSNTSSSNAALDGLTLQFQLASIDPNFSGYSAFSGLQNFAASDNCVEGGEVITPNVTGSAFSLAPGGSCTITVSFNPQQSCPWLASPSACPAHLPAKIIVNSPISADNDKEFAVPIVGTGLSFIQASTPLLAYSAEAAATSTSAAEASLPQMLSFTNTGAYPVQILGSAPCLNPPGIQAPPVNLPNDPLIYGAPVAGLEVAANNVFSSQIIPGPTMTSIQYTCDIDPPALGGSGKPNFQISSDTCTGTLLPSQGTCSLQITYVPQPAVTANTLNAGLDFLLELNTVQCWPPGTPPSANNPCEIDSGRFPVELKTNPSSPLRMLPSAGINFGNNPVGKSSPAQTITLLNDPAASTTINFIGRIQVKGNYSESDDCPFSLPSGSSCTLTLVFKPGSTGLNSGNLTINYNQISSVGLTTTGNPQTVYLLGTGQ